MHYKSEQRHSHSGVFAFVWSSVRAAVQSVTDVWTFASLSFTVYTYELSSGLSVDIYTGYRRYGGPQGCHARERTICVSSSVYDRNVRSCNMVVPVCHASLAQAKT
eukprot:1156552-Pelagomonas_calceolata.AAC.3